MAYKAMAKGKRPSARSHPPPPRSIKGSHFTTYKKKPQNEGGVLTATTEVVHFSATSSSFGGRLFGAPLRPPQTSKRLLSKPRKVYI